MNEAMALMEQLVSDGSIHPDTVNISAPEAREMFAQGQAGFLCQGMWCIPPWAQSYPDLNYGVMAVPVPDSGAKGGVQQVESAPWMGLYKQSKHPKEAAEYLMLYSMRIMAISQAVYPMETMFQSCRVSMKNI